MKKFRDLSIKTKLIAMQLLTTSVVLMFFGIYIVYDEWKEYQNSAVNQLTSAAQLLSSNSISSLHFLDAFAAEEVLSSLETQTDVVNAWIYDREGVLFAQYSKNGYEDYSFLEIDKERIQYTKGYIIISKKIIDDDEFLGMLSIRLDAAERWNSLLRNIHIIILALFAGMVIAFVLASIVQKKISRPIIELTDKSEQVIKTGDYSIRIEQESSDEIGYLSSAFNRMLEQTQDREAELDSARDQLQTVLDTVPGTISWLDSDLNYLGVNRNLADVFKLNPEDFVGQHLGFKGSSPEFVDFVQKFFKSEKKQVYKEINSTANNKELTHLIIGQKYAKNKAAVFIGIDITRIKEAEKKLRESEDKYRAIFNNTGTAMMIIEEDTTLSLVNDVFVSMTGFSKEEMEGKRSWTDFVFKEDLERMKEQHRLRRKNKDMALNSYEFRFVDKNGKTKHVYLTIEMIPGTMKSVASIVDITALKQTEKLLRESEAKYRTIFENTGTAMVIIEEDTTISLTNNEFVSLSGFSREEIEGKKLWTEFVLEEDLQRMKRQHELRRIDNKEAMSSYEFKFVNKDKDIKNILLSIGIVPGTKKSVASLINLTERKLAEEELRLSEEKFSKVFQSNPDLTGITSLNDGRFIEANNAFEKILGYKREDLIDRTVEEVGFWGNLEERKHLLAKLRRKGYVKNFELNYRSKSGEIMPFLANAQTMTLKGENCIIFNSKDMTELKHAQKLQQVIYNIGAAVSSTKGMTAFYKEVHNQLKNLLDASNFYVGLYDKAKNIINLPYIKDDRVEIEKFPAEYTVSNIVIQSEQSMLLFENDFQKFKKEGKIKLLGATSKIWLGVPLKIEDKVIGLIVVQSYDDENAYNQDDLALMEFVSGQIASSITRKQAEEALREAHNNLEIKVAERTKELADANLRLQELDRLKSMFLASMSHELRTPLNSIIGFTGLLLMGMAGEMNEEQKKQLGMVKNSANHLLSLINDILDISKIESGKIDLDIEEFELQMLINEIISETAPLTTEKGLKIFSEIENDIHITSDRRRVKQILMNLTANAIKFTDQGQVKISLHSLPAGNPQVTVTDSGMGIKDDDLAKLFQPFQQVDMSSSKRFEGTGLGLYLCQKLVNILGGEISAVSEYGKGSAFTFSLPLIYKTQIVRVEFGKS